MVDSWPVPFNWQVREEVMDADPFSYSDFSDTNGQTSCDDPLDGAPL